MTDDNTVDIGHRLPPIEVRKPWRQKLPSYYASKIDTLKDGYKSVRNLIAVLTSVRGDFPDDDVAGSYGAERVAKNIADAIVLLRCAEEKLAQALPSEEFMTPEDLKEFWEQRR